MQENPSEISPIQSMQNIIFYTYTKDKRNLIWFSLKKYLNIYHFTYLLRPKLWLLPTARPPRGKALRAVLFHWRRCCLTTNYTTDVQFQSAKSAYDTWPITVPHTAAQEKTINTNYHDCQAAQVLCTVAWGTARSPHRHCCCCCQHSLVCYSRASHNIYWLLLCTYAWVTSGGALRGKKKKKIQ